MKHLNMQYINLLKEIRCRNINSNEFLLLVALAMHSDDEGISYPRTQTIINTMRASRSTFFRTIKDLKDKGLVVMGKNDLGYTTYKIDLSEPGHCKLLHNNCQAPSSKNCPILSSNNDTQ